MDNFKSLEKLNLTNNEVNVYLFLLENSGSYGNKIYKSKNMDKSSTYIALKNLINKELVYTSGKTRNQKFYAHDPARLHDLWEKREQELILARDQIQKIISSLQKTDKSTHNIETFQGFSGYKLWMEDRLLNNTSMIKELSHPRTARMNAGDYYEYMKWFIPERVKRGISIRLMFDEDSVDEVLTHPEVSNSATLKEARIIKANLKVKASLVLYGSKTSFYSSSKGQFIGVIINDQMIHDLVDSIYDYLWSTGVKI
ncbi:hypothetical protein JW887_06660 [Candidatus Dojkabacteria bacterium]|nr:hypothetical protein [Candidatus Dojkabacteria bacterium]